MVWFCNHKHRDTIPRPTRKAVEVIIRKSHCPIPTQKVNKFLKIFVINMVWLYQGHQLERNFIFNENCLEGLPISCNRLLGSSALGIMIKRVFPICNGWEEEWFFRKSMEQIGVLIVLCNRELVWRALCHPNIGCDGTFNIVSFNNTYELQYALNTIVCKDTQLGIILPIFRHISSRIILLPEQICLNRWYQ